MSTKRKIQYLDPAHTVITRIGGIETAAQATGCHFSRVYRWMRPRDVGGTGGVIPHVHMQRLLDYARKHGKPLRPDDFFHAA